MSDVPSGHSIGIFDSGVGGLTVAKAIRKELPGESIIYFGDTARVPYGTKSKETVQRYAIENSIFLIERGIKLLVVACNTASAYAIERLQKIFRIPVVGVIEPGVARALEATRNRRIAVLGTQGTIASGVYQQKICSRLEHAQVFATACPLFVSLAEEGMTGHDIARLAAREYLQKLLDEDVDTVLLGCTHYPLLYDSIREVLGGDVAIVDSAASCAAAVRKVLKEKKLLSSADSGEAVFFVSDDPDKFRRAGCRFFGAELHDVSQAGVSNIHI